MSQVSPQLILASFRYFTHYPSHSPISHWCFLQQCIRIKLCTSLHAEETRSQIGHNRREADTPSNHSVEAAIGREAFSFLSPQLGETVIGGRTLSENLVPNLFLPGIYLLVQVQSPQFSTPIPNLTIAGQRSIFVHRCGYLGAVSIAQRQQIHCSCCRSTFKRP